MTVIVMLAKRCFCLFFILALFFSSNAFAADTTIIKSPDGNILFRLFQKNHQLNFSISFLGKTIIPTSAMNLSVNETSVTQNISQTKVERYTRNETYPIL